MKRFNRRGFTLAELLIVVAIIAVLVAIAIPVFTSQLEKAREATDLANIRSAYAEVVVDAIEDNDAADQTVTLKQTIDDWQTADAGTTLTDICGNASYVSGTPTKGKTATIAWVAGSGTGADMVDGHCTITFAGASASTTGNP